MVKTPIEWTDSVGRWRVQWTVRGYHQLVRVITDDEDQVVAWSNGASVDIVPGQGPVGNDNILRLISIASIPSSL